MTLIVQFLPLDDLREANNIDIVTESTEVGPARHTLIEYAGPYVNNMDYRHTHSHERPLCFSRKMTRLIRSTQYSSGVLNFYQSSSSLIFYE